ncbi:MAG: ABC transporter ATP-binding protein [Gammaproteobacteria bacterium]|nr:ABC transporter ATP-binding protein [Gammaproteobacteria bacterium]
MILSAQHLSLQRGDKTLCRDLSFSIEPAQCWGVIGCNGAGKTTLLHSLLGLYPLQHGQVSINQQARVSFKPKELAKQIGLLLQESEQGFPASVMDITLLGRHPHLKRWQTETEKDKQLAHAALQVVGLDDYAERSNLSLSGGEARRLAIASLLTQDPQLFLLDEPVNHLDVHQQLRILDHFKLKINEQQKSAMIVLHDINLVWRYCDYVILMFANGETRVGPVQALLNSEHLSALYQHTIKRIDSDAHTFFIPA